MGKALLITFAILISILAFIVYRTGYFKPVSIASGDQGPFVLVYLEHKGPYHKIAPVIDDVEETFKENKQPCPMAFGRYLHDPDEVPHDRLRSHGGCLFPQLNEQIQKIAKDNDFTVETLEKKEYIVAHFEGSPSVGPLKVYPYVEDWLKKYGYQQVGPVIEIYQTLGPDSLHTRYLFQYK